MIMGVEVVLPIRVNGDNIGAIFLAKNRTASDRNKLVDTRYHFVRYLIESNLIKVFFCLQTRIWQTFLPRTWTMSDLQSSRRSSWSIPGTQKEGH
jgi:hypothetical protein